MASAPPRPVSLALQGGGSHGAFTWGVLDAIAEDGRLDPRAITATSAGAMNAAAYAAGRHKDGPDGARQAMEAFWRAVSRSGAPFRPRAPGFSFAGLFPWLDAWSRVTSPYDLNPFGWDPLRDIIREQIDFAALSACSDVQLHVTATQVSTGRPKVFSKDELTEEALLASACLPFIRQAVEIDGEAYWDGGFTGNPALWPLFYTDAPTDLVIVHINPLRREGVPTTAEEILNRVNEITFNASLLAELRAVAFAKRLISQDLIKDAEKARLKDVNLHSIKADDALRDFGASSKYDTNWTFLTTLRDAGRAAAMAWLDRCAKDVGKRSTIDVYADFLG